MDAKTTNEIFSVLGEERTTELLTRHREILDRASRELLERETLDEADLRRLTAGIREQAGTAAE